MDVANLGELRLVVEEGLKNETGKQNNGVLRGVVCQQLEASLLLQVGFHGGRCNPLTGKGKVTFVTRGGFRRDCEYNL